MFLINPALAQNVNLGFYAATWKQD